ncbi:sulfotransferase [Okeania sp. SIO2G5]|uniref:sulfotransferase n=2 Tax=Okeania TaxID=1458928 RepID=UPI00257AB84A|nr:sulfotransferase [Okeania sp. SIO2G5]
MCKSREFGIYPWLKYYGNLEITQKQLWGIPDKNNSKMMTEKIISRTLETPFLIVGCPRSGTTLLQIIIDAHPNIIIPPESHIFERFSDIFNYYGDLQKDSNLYLFVKDILQD